MFVKPAPGIKVRHPASRLHIPETGIEVPSDDTYWNRRLRDGDVVEVTTAPAVHRLVDRDVIEVKTAPAAKAAKGKE